MTRFWLTATLGLTLATPAVPDVALTIGNARYDTLTAVPDAALPDGALRAITAQGVTLLSYEAASGRDLRAALADLADALQGAGADERIVVVLSGQFASSATDTFLLPVDWPRDGGLIRATDQALPVSAVMALLAQRPGGALLVLGQAGAAPQLDGAFLRGGPGDPAIPQGVTLITGPAASVAAFAAGTLAVAGADIVAGAAAQGLAIDGFVRDGSTAFSPADPASPVMAETRTEADAWAVAQAADSEAGYVAYLTAFPDGANAGAARAALDDIRTNPNRAARLAEDALSLSRDARRAIQRDLSILGYNTRGIDGIFGPGTRGAVARWQEANGVAATTYLTTEQIARLDVQAERRAAELEAEAEARRAEMERLDRAYWEETGGQGDAAGLRAYLKRYPDGVFAEVAAERLAVFEEQARARALEQDRAAWDQAADRDTADAYRAYLAAFPDGAFAEEAQARIAASQQSDADRQAEAQAQAAEAALGLNNVTRRLVEDRLARLNLNPGTVDGGFDDDTRRALRRYQQARNLPVTGYLNQDTVVRLLADAILR